MTSNKTIIKNITWVPALAFTLAVVLIVGQTLNCCRINETLSDSVSQVLKSLVHGGKHAAAEDKARSGKTHAGCHGHGLETEAESPSQPVPLEGPHFEAEESCLSEVAFSPKALQPVSTSDIGLSVPVIAYIPLPSLPRLAHVEKPRPQNKSGPPVYLLTRRLLV